MSRSLAVESAAYNAGSHESLPNATELRVQGRKERESVQDIMDALMP